VIQDNNIKTKILAEKMNENKNYFSVIPEISATNFVSIIIFKKLQPLADCPGYCLLQRWRTAPLPLLVPFAEDVVPVPASKAYLELTLSLSGMLDSGRCSQMRKPAADASLPKLE